MLASAVNTLYSVLPNNWVAERLNRTLDEGIITPLSQSLLWAVGGRGNAFPLPRDEAPFVCHCTEFAILSLLILQ